MKKPITCMHRFPRYLCIAAYAILLAANYSVAQQSFAVSTPAFIANRGQIVDDEGHPRPDILYYTRLPQALPLHS